MSASEEKANPDACYDARLSLLGDSFSIFSFMILAVVSCKKFLPNLSYQHLALRMGMAQGSELPFKLWLLLQENCVMAPLILL